MAETLFSINYLIFIAPKKVARFKKMSDEKVLDVLAMALQFQSYKDLCDTYNISSTQRHFGENDGRPLQYDISNDGFCFSEYLLREHLDISYQEAVELKMELDQTIDFEEMYDGNIYHSTRNNVNFGLSRLKVDESGSRIMGDWPLRFYASVQKKEIKFESGGTKHLFSLCFDGFNIVNDKYFSTTEDQNHYISLIFDKFLIYGDVFFLNNVISKGDTKYSTTMQYIVDKYQNHFAWIPNSNNEKIEVLYLPKMAQTYSKHVNKSHIGKQLKKMRTTHKISQQKLADLVGITREQISNLERNISYPGYSTSARLAIAFDISLPELMVVFQENPNC